MLRILLGALMAGLVCLCAPAEAQSSTEESVADESAAGVEPAAEVSEERDLSEGAEEPPPSEAPGIDHPATPPATDEAASHDSPPGESSQVPDGVLGSGAVEEVETAVVGADPDGLIAATTGANAPDLTISPESLEPSGAPRLEVELESTNEAPAERPLLEEPWFWVAAGVVLASIGTLAVVSAFETRYELAAPVVR